MADRTYEELAEEARRASIGQGYGAVVEIHNYLSASPPRLTTAAGRTPLVSHQSRAEFRAILMQFRNGQPYGVKPVESQPVAVESDADSDVLPF